MPVAFLSDAETDESNLVVSRTFRYIFNAATFYSPDTEGGSDILLLTIL